MNAPIKALAPWFGAKRSMAESIIEAIGPHRSYWEPFAGSLAVLLSKPPCGQETVCDLHGDLTNLAWVIQSEPLAVALHARLYRTVMSEGIFAQANKIVRQPFSTGVADGERAYWYMLTSWMGRNGMAGTVWTESSIAVRWTQNGGSPAGRFRSVVDSIPAWHERLRNVLVLRRDAFDVLAKIDDAAGCAIYCDPPYLMATRKAKAHTLRKGGHYRHEFEDDQHQQLSESLARFQNTRVVVSYYAHERLAELYPADRWRLIDCSRSKNLSVSGSRGSAADKSPEVLLINQPE